MDSIDKQLEAEEIRLSTYRKRLLYLVPFNFFSLFATMRYFRNIQKIAKRFWPKRQKATIGNLFLVGTGQALLFTTFYVGGSLAILGINPVSIYRGTDQLLGGPSMADLDADEKLIEQQV